MPNLPPATWLPVSARTYPQARPLSTRLSSCVSAAKPSLGSRRQPP